MRGVDTATSTPQASVNSHSLRGSLTRATTRGTANSVLASRLSTTLALSSPVAATTTSKSSQVHRLQQAQFAGIAQTPVRGRDGVDVDVLGVALDQRHVVAVADELAG